MTNELKSGKSYHTIQAKYLVVLLLAMIILTLTGCSKSVAGDYYGSYKRNGKTYVISLSLSSNGSARYDEDHGTYEVKDDKVYVTYTYTMYMGEYKGQEIFTIDGDNLINRNGVVLRRQ